MRGVYSRFGNVDGGRLLAEPALSVVEGLGVTGLGAFLFIPARVTPRSAAIGPLAMTVVQALGE